MIFVPIILFILTISVNRTSGQNSSCQFYTDEIKSLKIFCEQNRQRLPKNCVDEIPLNTTDVIRLKIERCEQSAIGDASERFQSIQFLDISHSDYAVLNWTGAAFEKVTDLNASFNNLTDVPALMLYKFPKLESLDLCNNNLTRILSDDFKILPNLVLINLSFNSLEFIDARAFDRVNQLSEINLAHNRFTTFPAAILPFQSIILLENPQLSTINCTFIEKMRSKHVYFTWKHITAFDGDQNCKKLNINLQSIEIDGIIPDSFNNFLILYNGESFKYIENFVVGSQAFGNVQPIFERLGASVLKIDLADNDPAPLSPNTFERFKNLRELNLSATGLHTFDFNLLNYQKYLVRLDISRNHLKAISYPILLQYLRHLTCFNAAENQIQNAHEILRYIHSSVIELNLAGNNVSDPTELGNFDRLTALTHLNLSDTNLSISDENPFNSLHQLISLDISNNNLSNLNFRSVLRASDKLQVFCAANSQLINVTGTFQPFNSSLHTFDLSRNHIGPLFNTTIFQILGDLMHLNLSMTNLQKFDLKAIAPLKELRSLDISQNQLRSIDLKILSNFTHLQRLYLNNNDLYKLDSNALDASSNISIAISRNHFSCMYLKQLKHEHPHLKYMDNQLDQRHGEDCQSSLQAIGDFLSSFYGKVIFW